ncbi:MAG: hypothetical protein U1E61_05420 [Bradyrhizobium sp.]
MKKIWARRSTSDDCQPARLEMRTIDADDLEQVAAAGSKPGGAGDGRGLPGDRREAP